MKQHKSVFLCPIIFFSETSGRKRPCIFYPLHCLLWMYLFWMHWEGIVSPNGILQIYLFCPADKRIHSFGFYVVIWLNLTLHMISVLISAFKQFNLCLMCGLFFIWRWSFWWPGYFISSCLYKSSVDKTGSGIPGEKQYWIRTKDILSLILIWD